MTADSFKPLADAGFLADLLPIIPPGAALSGETRVQASDLGKIPGKCTPGGWVGFLRWTQHETSRDDIAAWAHWPGVGVGVQTRRTPAIDIDVLEPKLADQIERVALELLGPAPRRVGQAPKRLLAYRIAEPIKKAALVFRHRETGAEHRVEILGDGQQFVARGVHPGTGRPYSWGMGCLESCGWAGLTEIDPGKLNAFLAELRRIVEAAGYEVTGDSGDAGTASDSSKLPIGDKALMADPEKIKSALEALGNSTADYDEWIKRLAAVKAALGGAEEHYGDYEAWCLLCPDNTPEIAREKWDSVHASSVGANYIFECARAAGWSGAQWDFEPIGGPVTFAELLRREPQPVREIVPALIEKGIATFLDGPGGVHKSRLGLQILLSVEAGAPVFGRAVEKCSAVYLSSEDDADEVVRRAHAITRRLDLPQNLSGLYWDCRGQDSALAEVHEGGLVKLLPFHKELRVRLQAMPGHKLVLVDSLYDFVRFVGKAKIDEGAINTFIKRTLGDLCTETDSTLLVIRHPSQAGAERGDFSGWSVANHNAPRARLSLSKDGKTPDAYLLKVEKRNHGPIAEPLQLFWSDGALLPRDAMETVEQEQRILVAVVEVALELAAAGQPFTEQKKPTETHLRAIEERCGIRPKSDDVKEALRLALMTGRLRYQAGKSHRQAGYFPPDNPSAEPISNGESAGKPARRGVGKPRGIRGETRGRETPHTPQGFPAPGGGREPPAEIFEGVENDPFL